ncbi:3'-5' exonuclease [Amycolatopsis minnesotensis]|uniref:3'-5' exonuclease n=1 Tax=Amycolatopsis minnesotensis TaxID=337894 RepID=A0ABN2Q5M9_9PSEU
MPDLIDLVRLTKDGRHSPATTEFTAIDVETTGLHPGHVVEIAAVRIRADGTVLGELSSLVDPGFGIDPGPSHVHRITRVQLDGAPSFGDLAGYLLELCRDSVLVAHNLPFEKRFLAQEFAKLGMRVPPLPGVCTLATSRSTLNLPNHRLATIAGAIGIEGFDSHTALADARVCALLVSTFVAAHGLSFTTRPRFADLPRPRSTVLPRPRPEAVPSGHPTWLAGMVDRLPTAGLRTGVTEDAYLEMLEDALADRHLSPGEAAALSVLADSAGLMADDVLRLHRGFVAALREVAEGDGIVTADEEHDLVQIAHALAVPEVLHGLHRTTPLAKRRAPRVLVLGTTAVEDELRAAVLVAGIPLAKKLTASVTHVVVGAGVPAAEPRLERARELGAAVLAASEARTALGLPSPGVPIDRAERRAGEREVVHAPVPPPRPPVPAQPVSYRVRTGQVYILIGLVLMVISVASQFGGAGLVVGLVVGVPGGCALLAGWYVMDGATPPRPRGGAPSR